MEFEAFAGASKRETRSADASFRVYTTRLPGGR